MISGLLTAAALGQMQAAVAQSTSPSFPRLGGYLIGGSVQSSFGTTSYQQQVAKLGAAVIGLYPGWSSGGFNMQSAAAAVKAINPNIKLTSYTRISWSLSRGSAAAGPRTPQCGLPSMLTTGSCGLRGPTEGSPTRMGWASRASTKRPSGYLQWRAGWTAANEFGSNWDGIYLDNVFWQPRVSADYSQSGSSQSPSAAAQSWRNGYAAYVPLLKAALPRPLSKWGKHSRLGQWFDQWLQPAAEWRSNGIHHRPELFL